MIIGAGGNTSSQTSVQIIQLLTVASKKEPTSSKLFRILIQDGVFLKEFLIAVMVASTLGFFTYARVWIHKLFTECKLMTPSLLTSSCVFLLTVDREIWSIVITVFLIVIVGFFVSILTTSMFYICNLNLSSSVNPFVQVTVDIIGCSITCVSAYAILKMV